jgi:hypothetical protein
MIKRIIVALMVICTLKAAAITFIPAIIHFCSSLVADDPYQYEDASVDMLVRLYYRFKSEGYQSPALISEMKFRLTMPGLSAEDRELLEKTLKEDK